MNVPDYDNQTSNVAPTDMPTAVPNPCLTYNTGTWNAAYKRNLVGIPVQSYDSNASLLGGRSSLAKQADTDVLVVRHADTVPATTDGGNCEADVVGTLYFQVTQCNTELGTPYVARHDRLHAAPARLPRRRGQAQFVSNLYYVRTMRSPQATGSRR